MIEKKYEDLKKKNEELRNGSTMNNEKLYKLEFENEKLKKEISSLKQGSLENSKKIKGYETKESK